MRPAAVSSGESHHRSVRSVFAVICARPVAGSRVEDTSAPVLDGFHFNNLAFCRNRHTRSELMAGCYDAGCLTDRSGSFNEMARSDARRL